MLFTVAAPPPYHNSAGIVCLHELMRCLRALGHEVVQLDYSRGGEHTVRGILIAPEVLTDVPIPHVRWVLNVPGLLGGPKTYPEGTICFHYCQELEEASRAASPAKETHEMILGHIDIPAFIPDSRHLICYYGGKFTQFGGVMQEHPFAIEIRRDYPADKKKYWELMQQCHTLYSYDSFSALNAEAHLLKVNVWIYNPETQAFDPYKPPGYIDRIIWNDERNMREVANMVDIIKAKM